MVQHLMIQTSYWLYTYTFKSYQHSPLETEVEEEVEKMLINVCLKKKTRKPLNWNVFRKTSALQTKMFARDLHSANKRGQEELFS